MARRKLTDAAKIEMIQKNLLNLVGDICTNKAVPELLGIVQSEIALCLAIIQTDTNDEFVIGKNWAELEAKILQDRAVARGVVMGQIFQQGVLQVDDKPKGKNSPK